MVAQLNRIQIGSKSHSLADIQMLGQNKVKNLTNK